MLTASQIEALQLLTGQLLDPITDYLIADIAQRVAAAGQLTSTAAYEIWRAQNLGISQKKLKKEIAKRLEISLEEVEQLLTQAAETGYRFDLERLPTTHAIPLVANSSLQQILQATVQQAREDLTNITRTMGFVGSDGKCRELTEAYRQACDFAFQKTVTGAQDYVSAIRDATRNLAEKGIRFIDYKSGKHYSIEAAVRQNIMGSLGLMQEQITQNNHDTLGCDGWEISAHQASAPDHEPIQGKQYSDAEFYRLNNSLLRRIGTLNCGHATFPIILGVNSPQYTEAELEAYRRDNEEGVTVDGRHYTKYQATQRQRQYERAIRKQKSRILVDESAGDTQKLQTDQIRLQVLKQDYARFSEKADLPMQHARMEVAGFTWKHGKAAESAAKNQNNQARASVNKGNVSYNKGYSKKANIAERHHEAKETIWDHSRGTNSWGSERRKKLLTTEKSLARSPVEIGTLYDAEGKRIFRKKGDAGSVEFTPAQIKQMRGGVLTHNHPGADYGCFSPADINMLRVGHLHELRCVTPAGVFSIQRPQRWPTSINGLEKIKELYYDIDDTIGSEYFARAFRGEISLLDANNMGQRAVVEELCKRNKIPFRFESWDDLTKE